MPVSLTIGFHMQTRAADIYDPNLAGPELSVSANMIVAAVIAVPSSRDDTFKSQTTGDFTAKAVFQSTTFPVLPSNNHHQFTPIDKNIA